MAAPSHRLACRVRRDFEPEAASEVLRLLTAVPDELPGPTQDAERMQAALVLAAGGDLHRFRAQLALARLDYRDALIGGGLGHLDWPERLDVELGRAGGPRFGRRP